MQIEVKGEHNCLVPVEYFIKKGEYDQGDWAIIDYDDLIDYIEKIKKDQRANLELESQGHTGDGAYC